MKAKMIQDMKDAQQAQKVNQPEEEEGLDDDFLDDLL